MLFAVEEIDHLRKRDEVLEKEGLSHLQHVVFVRVALRVDILKEFDLIQ
jgi:hypothetical protein